MESALSSLQNDIQKFAETISEIIQIDVEIMDKNFIRIGGTGNLKNKIGESMTRESHIYKKVLETGKEFVILNPKKEEHCSECPNIKNCKEKLEVSTPILLKSEVIGVIGLICFDSTQKEEFIKKKDKYLNFLRQISSLISSQVSLSLESSFTQNSILHVANSTTGTLVKDFIFYSDSMKNLFERINKISKNPSTVLITGESGTGKEIIARTIHMNSHRVNQSFIAVNCGAIPEALLESEFFGYVKGSFTGADPRGKIGKFELANKGTLFLDEIGDMPLYMQIKLLRVLQERKIIKIGSNELIDIDVRIIAATNQNLEKLVETGEFRKDLYYRLNVVPIEVPALRNRPGDIIVFAEYFAAKYANLFQKNFVGIAPSVLEAFQKYSWPGNVRELENSIEYMINLMGDNGVLSLNHLPTKFSNFETEFNFQEKTLKDMEIEMISTLIHRYGHSTESKKHISKILGIGIATLYRKLELYNIKH